MVFNNNFSNIACQELENKNNVESILQRITPIEFVPNLTTEYLGTLNMAYLTGPNLGTLTVQSNLETLNIEALSGYIHELAVDTLTINGFTGLYTGPTGVTGCTGPPGDALEQGPDGPIGASSLPDLPLEFLSPSQTTLSITDPAPTVIRSNVSFEAGTPADGFSKVVINGYTGPNILSPIATSIGSMLNGPINTMETVGNTVYIGGNFTGSNDGTKAYPRIAKWDVINGLQQVNGSIGPSANVYSMVYDTTKNLMYVGGDYTMWGGLTGNPPYIGSFNVSTKSFKSLGTSGFTGNSPCLSLALDTSGKLYSGWNSFTPTQQLFIYDNGTWTGCTGLSSVAPYPKKILVDNANTTMYVGYGSTLAPFSELYRLYSINTEIGANTLIYNATNNGSSSSLTMTMDNSNKLYIGVKPATEKVFLPFGGKSYMGTYVYGGNVSPFQEITNPINYLNYDKTNSELYICANTFNSTLSTNINGQPYQSIVKYDGASFQNVADVDVFSNGILAPLNNSTILISPYNLYGSYKTQPSKISETNQIYMYNGAWINKNASLSITAPINYSNGNTGSSYTLYKIGDKVDMKWSSTTNSWWV